MSLVQAAHEAESAEAFKHIPIMYFDRMSLDHPQAASFIML